MWSKFITWLTISALHSRKLSGEQKSRITATLLENFNAIPIRDIITFEQGQIRINGRTLDVEQAIVFRESAHALHGSYARKVIHDQITFEALKMGTFNGINPDMILFAKAALWNQQEENRLLDSILVQ